ncbi:tRNA (adenosine(37)-N6)-threonylcarbamoyltransferase complex transferase subunit TsaD [Candidatus Dojkabacteria bacterium]|nr:tRNA (adenosine(37)-N6)-threonylcarbamoyltransferase complex transferase subunit TsaD [Candidatus Dojkabacteria bacterium]
MNIMREKEPTILGIDTSCDETSIAISVGRRVLSSIRATQVEIHREWGGVVPMIAKRAHEENIQGVYEEVLKKAKVSIQDVDYVAVTKGPGLAIDLEVGITFAKELCRKYDKPLIAVNHMEGHLLSSLTLNSKGVGLVANEELEDLFPALGLLMSGKHTEIIYVEGFGQYRKLGLTLDDAAGEAFDKVGRMLDFGYPGGPVVSEFAKRGKVGVIPLPIPLERSKDLNFSYSGLKTAVLYKIKEFKEKDIPQKEWVYDLCRSFVNSIERSVVIKLEMAIEKYPEVKSVFVGGGVFSSEYILRSIGKIVKYRGLRYLYPKGDYRSDNAGMICIAGYYSVQRGEVITTLAEIENVDRDPRLSL